MINIIVAYDENRVIGKDNKLPWHIPEDFKHFKETTMGCPCIVGRRTYEGMGALKGRLNIVLSRTGGVGGLPSSDPVFYEYSLEEAIALARESKVCTEQGKDIFILGGSSVYEHALAANLIDKIIASEVKGSHEGDAFFPKLEDGKWDLQLIKEYDMFNIIEYTRIDDK